MSDDDAKKDDARAAILARRARFVAAAMASISIACGKESKNPEPCLSVVAIDSGATEPAAVDASPEPVDASPSEPPPPPSAPTPEAGSPTDAGTKPKPDAAAPHPCLRVAPPRPCLKVAPSR